MKTGKYLLLLFCFILVAGCALLRWRGAEIYPLSYDQTYEMAIDAMDDLDPWRLLRTDYANGIIIVGYEEYMRPPQQVQFIVKRIEPFRTKVELDGHWPSPLNQKFFKAMDKRVENRILTYPT
jgi:hypothetical protein